MGSGNKDERNKQRYCINVHNIKSLTCTLMHIPDTILDRRSPLKWKNINTKRHTCRHPIIYVALYMCKHVPHRTQLKPQCLFSCPLFSYPHSLLVFGCAWNNKTYNISFYFNSGMFLEHKKFHETDWWRNRKSLFTLFSNPWKFSKDN